MSTKTGNKRRAILSGAVASFVILASAWGVRADVASDKPGAIIVFPKIVVDLSGQLGPRTDTEIQLTNTSNSVISARCWIVNANSYCSLSPPTDRVVCRPDQPLPTGCGACVPQWQETDFRMTLTKRQPISWRVSQGLSGFPCDGVNGFCPDGQSNRQSDGLVSSIPPVQDDPFFGEIKCVEVDPQTFQPTIGFNPANNAAGDLKGEATIVSVAGDLNPAPQTDARKYNGITIPAIGPNNGDDVLVLGGDNPDLPAEYSHCPNVIILNHLFDNANVSTHRGTSNSGVITHLTVVPCSEDFNLQENNLGGATLQFLVYNEFEQRFSTSIRYDCWREIQLSNIDTRESLSSDNPYSIFNVAVEGTLAGQTRIRPVGGAGRANAILAVSEEFWFQSAVFNGGTFSDATNTHFTGIPPNGRSDFLILSPQ